MFRLILGLVLVYFVLRAVSRFLHGVARGLHGSPAQQNAQTERRTKAVPLARDPVCGTYVVPSHALTSGSGTDIHYFCSERCRRQWASR